MTPTRKATASDELLPDVWERWSPALDYLNDLTDFPIRDQASLQSHFRNNLEADNIVRLEIATRQFTIDFIEVSPRKFDIVAVSVMKYSMPKRLLGGMVISELSPIYPRAFKYDESIRGMGIVRLDHTGRVFNSFLKFGYVVIKGIGHNSISNAEVSRKQVVQVAKEEKVGKSDEEYLLEGEAAFYAEQRRHFQRPDHKHNEALMRSQNEIFELKNSLVAKEDEIKKTKQVNTQLEAENERHIQVNHQLQLTNADLKAEIRMLRLQVKDTEGMAKRLRSRSSNAEIEAESTIEHVEDVEDELKRIFKELHQTNNELQRPDPASGRKAINKYEQIYGRQDKKMRDLHGKLASTQRNLPQSDHVHGATQDLAPEFENNLEATEKTLTNIAELEERVGEQLVVMDTNKDAASDELEEQGDVIQLKRELETTKLALETKTDELASATEKHTKELIEAGGNKEKCRCKDKEAYLESVEEHVEKLRGTMEDVLRHVSTYQGRKRRRNEGPDFEY